MPLFGILFMVVLMYCFSRFFGVNRGICSSNRNQSNDVLSVFAELRREIHELRMEIKELRDKNMTNDKKEEDS